MRSSGWSQLVVLALLAGTAIPAAQPASRKSTTVEALLTYPAFFHGQPVRVRGEVRARDREAVLVGQAREIDLAGPQASVARAGERVEVLGTYLDPGRVEPGDPRLGGLDVASMSRVRLGKPWPGIGELPLLVPDVVEDAPPYPSPSLRALALEPDRFVDQTVRVVGRFRGRNLFGDQPTAPGRSRWDFVLQSADASIWVTGMRPRGSDFALEIERRADANRWLEVSGTVRAARGLVFVEATAIRLAPPPDDAPAEPVARVTTAGPPPEVIFSTPTEQEIDVPATAPVRIQFSRDLAADTLKGRVRVSYLRSESEQRGEPQPPPLDVTVTYNEAARAMEIRFAEPLARFRTVVVELLEGIQGIDGAPLPPWRLTFTVGG